MKPWNYAKQERSCEICQSLYLVSPSSTKKTCSKNCMKILMSHQRQGTQHPLWKGENASYSGLHHWVRRHLGTPQECKHCGISGDRGVKRGYHWANISGEYRRTLTDWVRLCVPCHSKFDHSRKELHATK